MYNVHGFNVLPVCKSSCVLRESLLLIICHCYSSMSDRQSFRAKRLIAVRELFTKVYRSSVPDIPEQPGGISRSLSGLLSKLTGSGTNIVWCNVYHDRFILYFSYNICWNLYIHDSEFIAYFNAIIVQSLTIKWYARPIPWASYPVPSLQYTLGDVWSFIHTLILMLGHAHWDKHVLHATQKKSSHNDAAK